MLFLVGAPDDVPHDGDHEQYAEQTEERVQPIVDTCLGREYVHEHVTDALAHRRKADGDADADEDDTQKDSEHHAPREFLFGRCVFCHGKPLFQLMLMLAMNPCPLGTRTVSFRNPSASFI
jgi:hypothetical protein